tara:strand:+ start:520 stop:1041 length:522 start_codon:yes stop_codon:yes gene_type:complete
MKRLFLLVVFYFFFNPNEASSQSYFKDEYQKVWKRAANYSMAVAEAMPERHYDFKVHPQGMSFKEQQLHIVTNISFLTQLISEEERIFYNKENMKILGKKEVMKVLKTAFRYVAELLESIKLEEVSRKIEFNNESTSKENIFYLLRDHMTHHRGQAIIYLRLQNIEVPNYIGW